jgi:hypothetical protein
VLNCDAGSAADAIEAKFFVVCLHDINTSGSLIYGARLLPSSRADALLLRSKILPRRLKSRNLRLFFRAPFDLPATALPGFA